MKKILEHLKNKKVLALYLVGVLLLSSGLSYAFFTATSSVSGNGSISSADTATVKSEGLVGDGNISFSEADIYPGHTAIASIKVTGTGENTPLLYNVIFEGTNTFTTPINYTIYKLDQNIEVSYSCTPTTKVVSGAMMYYEECTGNNITSLGSPIKSGTICNGKTTLLDNEVIVTSLDGTITYYYVVIEYPNQDNEQNADIGSTLSGTIKVESNGEYPTPSVVFVGNTTQGSNGWYKSASITSNITSYTDDYEVEYCTTTSETCIPDTSPTLSDNSFTVNLDNNANEQRVCVRITDSYNQIGKGCSLGYKVDGENPTVTITNETVDKTSISITVNGSDSYSGITSYKFSKDNGSNYETINTSEDTYTYTFNNLESGTKYNIKVQVIDNAGNIGEVSKEISTESDREAANYILAKYSTVLTRTSFSTTVRNTTTGTIYKSANESQYDDDGEVYYFAGKPTDNWFYFGGYYWRIVRINGDGSIRLIYNGTSTAQTGDSTMINTSKAFNSSHNNNMYVGYMYQSGQVHGLKTNSSIKKTLDNWYLSNLADDAEYIDGNAGFCGDRTPYSGSGTGTSSTDYAAYNRLVNSKNPSFKCTYEDASGVKQDLYTTPGSSKGNGALKVDPNDEGSTPTPIGLITADEVAFAGGVHNQSNTSNYLYNNANYWTMSPYSFGGGYAVVFIADSGGYLGWAWLGEPDPPGVRPVINLRADVSLTGSGTTSDPFKVAGAS